jgi:intracellular septation protein
MKQLFEFFPIVLFFIAYKVYGIYVATEVMIGATTLGVALTWLKYRQVTTMQWITLVLAVVLGGATIYLHDERFLKWKLSIVEWLFGIAFLGSQFIGKKPFVERMMSSNLTLPALVWKRLNLMWGSFFITVMQHYNTDDWVTFKTFGVPALMIVFILVQIVFIYKYLPETED